MCHLQYIHFSGEFQISICEVIVFSCLVHVYFSKQLLDVLCLACGVPESSYDQFVTDLAEDKCGFSIVYMHHKDSMRSGTSYQNEAHLTFKEHLQVSWYLQLAHSEHCTHLVK